jgi:Uma2 family endonuclease
MAQARTRPMTADDLLALPSGMGQRYELIEGELMVTAAAGGRHGAIAQKVAGEMYVYLQNNPIGILLAAETGFYTRGDENTVRAPDLAFIRNEKIPPEGISDSYLHIVPDLVLEVVSPNDRAGEVDDKIQEWLNFGAPVVWVAYPSSSRMMVYRKGEANAVILNAGDTLDGGSVLPGFQRVVTDFFRS